MNRYNEQSHCPKCDNKYVATKFLKLSAGQEVIGRTCLRCGYGWNEKPLNEDK